MKAIYITIGLIATAAVLYGIYTYVQGQKAATLPASGTPLTQAQIRAQFLAAHPVVAQVQIVPGASVDRV